MDDGDDTVILASTEDEISIDGGSGTADQITGPEAATTWSTTVISVSGSDVTFGNIEVLQGGSDVDTFDIGAAATLDIRGGAGSDVFNINDALTGLVDGEGDSDTLQGVLINNVTLTNIGSTDGFAGRRKRCDRRL